MDPRPGRCETGAGARDPDLESMARLAAELATAADRRHIAAAAETIVEGQTAAEADG